jgi:hypothetical protein
MNNKIKFLELVLGDLISNRDMLEMDLNQILNNVSVEKRTSEKKTEFIDVLSSIVSVNNKIKTLSEYLSQFTVENSYNEESVKNSNNNK